MTYIGISISAFILLGALRQGTQVKITDSIYWLIMGVYGLSIVSGGQYSSPFIIIIPYAVRLVSKYWMNVKINWKDLVEPLPIIMVLVLLVFFTEWDFYVLVFYLLAEVYFQVKSVNRFFRSKGISLLNNTSLKINLLVVFYLFNFTFLLLLCVQLLDVENPIYDKLTLINYLLITLTGMVRYAGNPEAYNPIIVETKYAKSTLDQAEKYRILQQIDFQLNTQKFYLNTEASLSGLAKLVHANGHQVSQVINETKGMSFFELLAFHRVQEAKKLLRNPRFDHYKIEQIGEEVGYLSKSAFNTSFKKITGHTPSDYKSREVRDHDVEHRKDREITEKRLPDSTFGHIKISTVMFSNFFKVYFRNQLRNKAFATLNIMGLVIGITSSLLIIVYLNHELSYDKFHDRADDIYRIAWMTSNPQTRTPHPMAQAMVQDFSQVESGVSLTPLYGPGLTLQSVYVRNPETNVMFREADAYMVDSTFFDVFDYQLIVGDPRDALDDVGDIVISNNLAKKFFGSENPLGKFLELPEYGFKGIVSAVMETPPSNSHFHPQIMFSYVTRKSIQPDLNWWTWNDFGHFNYIRLEEGIDPRNIEDAIPDWLINYIELTEDQLVDVKARRYYFGLQPITDIHLRSNLRWELEANSNIIYIYILGAAVIFLVVIAAINYINLSTARAIERSKEVGIRRTLGARKAAVSMQFILESLVTCIFALILGYGLAYLFFEQFIDLTGKYIAVRELLNPVVVVLSLIITLGVGIITGIYPALFVVRIRPVEVLKGKFVNQAKGSGVRLGLIAIQFIVSTILIFGTIIILRQIKYIEHKKLGFDQEQTIVLELHTDDEVNRLKAIKNDIKKIPGVIQAGGISNLPGSQFNQNSIWPIGKPDDNIDCSELRVDYDALQLLGIELKEGRWFDQSMGMDSAGVSYILNESAVDLLNMADVFSTKVIWDEESGLREGNIVGVINDFNYKSLHQSVQPLIININPDAINYLLVKIDGDDFQSTIDQLALVHSQFDDQFEFDFIFLDGLIASQYDAERKALGIFNLFTFLALILAAMGLLGLAYLVITQRTREIGIRKVMGAKILDILIMENKTFLKIIVIAIIVGLPISYLLMMEWLNAFSYRIDFSIMPFLITIGILVAIAVFSVTLAVLRTVLINPSVALRYE